MDLAPSGIEAIQVILRTATLNQIHVTNISKFNNRNISETSKSVTLTFTINFEHIQHIKYIV